MLTPTTFKEAMALPETARWKAAADKEKKSLRAHAIHELVPVTSIPPGQNSISLHCVYRTKTDNSLKGCVVLQA